MRMTPFLFRRKTSNRRTDAARELKVHARAVINADDNTVFSISERHCDDPGCGGAQTVVLVMHPRRPTEAVKIDKPLEQVTQSDLSEALVRLVAQTALSELPPKPK
jgi:hypothetical protein